MQRITCTDRREMPASTHLVEPADAAVAESLFAENPAATASAIYGGSA